MTIIAIIISSILVFCILVFILAHYFFKDVVSKVSTLIEEPTAKCHVCDEFNCNRHGDNFPKDLAEWSIAARKEREASSKKA